MKNEILAVLLMTLVVLVSGCTMPDFLGGGGETPVATGTQGLAITYFGPDVEFPTPGQSIYIEARVKNVGEVEATNIGGDLYLTTWSSSKESSCTKLKPPNPEIGRDGEECILKWKVTTPTGITRKETYDIGAHITYGHSTKTVATVYAFSEGEYIKRMEAGQTIPTVKEIKNSNAPIHVDVRIQNVLKTGSSNVPVTLIFRNVGGGNVKFDSIKRYYIIDKATAKINEVTVGSCSNIHLRGGREGSCSININVPAGKELKLPIEIKTEYIYETSGITKVTVNPMLE